MELLEGTEGSSSAPPRDKVYVAVGSQIKLNQKNLEWALKVFGEADFFILHIHRPSSTMPGPMGGKVPCSSATEQKIKEFRKEERKNMEDAIQRYMAICAAHKVNVGKLVSESTDVPKGIVDLLSEHIIKILVMGAAADSSFDKKMLEPTSRKARYVNANAPPSCRIWFICKGTHICTREVSTSHNPTMPERIQSERVNRIPTKGKSMIKQFFSFPANRGRPSSQAVAVPQLGRGVSDASSIFSTDNSGSTSEGSAPTEENDYNNNVDDDGVNELKWVSEVTELQERNDELEKKNFLLIAKRNDVEKENTSLIAELQKRNDELEKRNSSLLARIKEMQRKIDRATDLSTQNRALLQEVTELTGINRSLQRQNDEAIQALEQLKEAQLAHTNINREISLIPNFLHFDLAELKEATNGFAQEMEIGRGGFGTVYKGKLLNTTVAIKRLFPEITHSGAFYQEIQALTRVRHPNLVALIGACPEERCLIYEFVENGSLKDNLFDRKDDSPLSCRDRLRIAAEICLALHFLHSTKPQPIVHGDLKPDNILLDANNKAKIADFGICRFLPEPQRESANTIVKLTTPKGTLGYMDPEFMATTELTFKSDVYAFGIILLQLLTGKNEFGLVKAVETALDGKKLYSILDPSAGKWNLGEATRLSSLGLQCCETNRRCRPNLKKVWGLLERYL